MNTLTEEQVFLLALSSKVWMKRQAAKECGLAYNEETITETILLDLKTHYPGNVEIAAFNKNQEATTGADWIWSFVNADGSMSFTMLVQAKRLENAERNYHGINRNIGTQTPPVRQIDKLLDTARNQGIPAVYAFYNHVSDLRRIPHKCDSLISAGPHQIHCFGISLSAAPAVAAKLPDEKFDTHKLHSIPLHCLLCSFGNGTRPSGGTPEMASKGVARLFAALSEEPERTNPGLLSGLHPTVARVLELSKRRDGDHDLPKLDDMQNIAGIVVLKDKKGETE